MIIPSEVKNILTKLQAAGFESYLVGGCVRDLLLGEKPKDWDVAANALPEEVQAIFSDSFYENKFGTVSVKISNKKITPSQPSPSKGEGEGWEFVEVTTYRVDEKYTDKRHPDAVRFTRNLRDDLARRDFTINAMALGMTTDYGLRTTARFTSLKDEISSGQPSPYQGEGEGEVIFAADGSQWSVVNLFNGQEDLKNGIIRAVGEPDERFNEDALRMLRAVRFAVELSHEKMISDESSSQNKAKQNFSTPPFLKGGGEGFKFPLIPLYKGEKKKNNFTQNGLSFTIEPKTKAAIKKNAAWLRAMAKERIRDEFIKIIMSERPDEGIVLLQELGLLEYVIPELVKGVGVAQNRHHIYTIFEHNVFSLKFAAQKKFNLVVRLAALLHDIAKPQAKRGEGPESTFYNHDIMGAKAAMRILQRLRFDNETIERAARLIRYHMFVYDVGAVTEAGVRRLLARVGPANMNDLLALRVADRLGSGVPKAQPYRLRHFQYMMEKVQHDPISVKMIKINGNDIMELLKIKPGPKIGAILDVLLAEVIEDTKKNTKEYLFRRAQELDEADLIQLRRMAREKIEEEKEEEDKVIKKKYWV